MKISELSTREIVSAFYPEGEWVCCPFCGRSHTVDTWSMCGASDESWVCRCGAVCYERLSDHLAIDHNGRLRCTCGSVTLRVKLEGVGVGVECAYCEALYPLSDLDAV